MKNFDFTLTKYKELCKSIKSSEYIPITMHDYLMQNPSDKCIIMRHDVDREPEKALKMAHVEKDFGLSTTYYFRMTDDVFIPNIIGKIKELGHEVGYHYEVLDKTKGDFDKAIYKFEDDLKEFRKICEIKTICMHGNPLSKWVNKDLWDKYDFKYFGIIGEPYLSIDYKKVCYLTDTGRKWNSRFSVKDVVDSSKNKPVEQIENTDDLINFIHDKYATQICILTHPNRWNDDLSEWLKEFFLQNVKNAGKAGIIWYKKL